MRFFSSRSYRTPRLFFRVPSLFYLVRETIHKYASFHIISLPFTSIKLSRDFFVQKQSSDSSGRIRGALNEYPYCPINPRCLLHRLNCRSTCTYTYFSHRSNSHLQYITMWFSHDDYCVQKQSNDRSKLEEHSTSIRTV